MDWDNDWDHTYGWSSNVEYIMTNEGLKRTTRLEDELEQQHRTDTFKANIESNGVKVKIEGKVNDDERRYRYENNNKGNQSNPPASRDTTTKQQEDISIRKEIKETTEGNAPEMVTPLYMISRFVR